MERQDSDAELSVTGARELLDSTSAAIWPTSATTEHRG